VAGVTSAGPPRVAVVGTGHWGRNLVRVLGELGALAAVCDVDVQRAAQLGAAHGAPARELSDVLADAAVEAVVVAAPAALHASLATRCLQADKHVFVEKPLALEVAEAEALVALAAERGRVLMVGHLLQYHPVFTALRGLVADGRIGRLQYVYSNRLNLGKFRREEDILWSFAPHDISMILSLVGEEPADVTAVGAAYLHPTIADVTTTHLTFASGPRAHVFVSWLHPYKEQRLVVVGDAGMAVFDDGQSWESKLQLYPHRVDWHEGLPEPVRADAEPVEVPHAEPLREECLHFLDCIATGTQPRTDGAEGLRVLRVLDRARAALGGAAPPAAAAGDDRAAVVHPTAVVDDGVVIGEGTRVWHFSHLLPGTRIGADCTLGQNVVIGPDVTVGDRCKIQNNVSLYKGVTLEDGVFCGPSCVFTNVLTPRAEVERKTEFLPTVVRRGATIGANATIVCGNEIGAYATVAAGAVVTRDVPPHALVAGVPARRIGWVGHAGERLGPDLVCPRTGRRYALEAPERLVEAS
jgi:UDP-2-acetamido-3-amino-2,3-dideoxy-glucuronate N-acetyltransferase